MVSTIKEKPVFPAALAGRAARVGRRGQDLASKRDNRFFMRRLSIALCIALLSPLVWGAPSSAAPPWRTVPTTWKDAQGHASRLNAVLWLDRLPRKRLRFRGHFTLQPPVAQAHITQVWLEGGGLRWSSPVRDGQLLRAPRWARTRPVPIQVIARVNGTYLRTTTYLEPAW